MVRNTVEHKAVTARKKAIVNKETAGRIDSLEHKETEDFYEVIARSSPVGVYIFQDGHFCWVNPRFEELPVIAQKSY